MLHYAVLAVAYPTALEAGRAFDCVFACVVAGEWLAGEAFLVGFVLNAVVFQEFLCFFDLRVLEFFRQMTIILNVHELSSRITYVYDTAIITSICAVWWAIW